MLFNLKLRIVLPGNNLSVFENQFTKTALGQGRRNTKRAQCISISVQTIPSQSLQARGSWAKGGEEV